MADGEQRVADGSFDFSQGVDSGRVPTIESPLTVNGLKRSQVAWANNAIFRGGGIRPRPGWSKLCRVADGGLYQAGYLYDASAISNALDPYLMLQIGGRILQVRVDTDNSVVDLSASSGLTNPPAVVQGYMCQGEEFLVIQAGDYTTQPIFWDGNNIRRASAGGTIVGGGGEFANVTFTVPPIGEAVLLDLIGAYTGADNKILQIDGHSYLHVRYDQQCIIRFPTLTPGTGGLALAGSSLQGQNHPISGVTLTDVPVTLGGSEIVYATGAWPELPTIYSGGSETVHLHYDAKIANGFIFRPPHTAPYLTPPVVNQIWVVNIDDPRAGQSVTIGDTSTPGSFIASELPPAGPMDYYMGRLWYAQGRIYTAGDIVGGTSGTATYKYRDSILKVTENLLAIGGDGFSVPSNSGDITALTHPANLDAALGQGQLTVFTAKSAYQLSVPITRAQWAGTGTGTEPLQTVVQKTNGTIAERSVVSHNGDIFYQAVDGIRSLITAVRYFGQWSNPPISSNVYRALNWNDDTLMQLGSAIVFDNRLLQTCFPVQTSVGIAYRGILPLDFDLISTLQDRLPPAWEGVWEGLSVLQLFCGQYGGRQRAFAVVAADDGGIDVWEFSFDSKTDSIGQDKRRITWSIETPAWTNSKEFQLKKLDGGEIWLDRVSGTVEISVYYRPDADPCWHFWHREKFCVAADTCEDSESPICPAEYPEDTDNGFAEHGLGYRAPLMLPSPPMPKCAPQGARPANQGFQFQTKIIVKGYCRIRGIMVYMNPLGKLPFAGLKG